MSAFEELGVMPAIIRSLSDLGWELPTPVQTEAIPLILGGGDVAVAAETGTGKTGAFCIPILQIVHEALTGAAAAATGAAAPSVEDDFRAEMGLATALGERSRRLAVAGPVAQARSFAAWHGVRGTRGAARGRWAWSAALEDEGLGRVGFAKRGSSLLLGTDDGGYGYGSTGMKSHRARFHEYGGKYVAGDVITCLLDFEAMKGKAVISYMKNGVDLGTAFTIPKDGERLYPALALKNAQMRVEFNEIDRAALKLGYKPFSHLTRENSAFEEPPAPKKDPDGDVVMEDSGKQLKGGSTDIRQGRRTPLALILEPARELAGQVISEITKFAKHLDDDSRNGGGGGSSQAVKTLLLIGGGDPKVEAAALKSGVDIVCGTLGTIESHLKRKTLDLAGVRFFVLDEADTFATDNLGTVLSFHRRISEESNVQTLLFSATLHSPEIRELSEKIQQYPTWIDLKGKESVPDSVHHTLIRLDPDADAKLIREVTNEITNNKTILNDFEFPHDHVHSTTEAVAPSSKKKKSSVKDAPPRDAADQRSEIVKKLKLCMLKKVIDANEMSHAMIFCRTQLDCDNVETFLLYCSKVALSQHGQHRFRGMRESGPSVEYSCAVLHAGRSQKERESALEAFRLNAIRFLICTDVAARGIDITGLPYLVNVTLPDRAEYYIHRVGRVGRAETPGLAVSLVAACKEAVWYHSCGKAKKGVCPRKRLVNEGGCVMWYNEEKLLEEIEERLKGKIECLEDGFKRKDEKKMVVYGVKKEMIGLGEQTQKHIDERKDIVSRLMDMEHEVQLSFLRLQQRLY